MQSYMKKSLESIWVATDGADRSHERAYKKFRIGILRSVNRSSLDGDRKTVPIDTALKVAGVWARPSSSPTH